ncbi:uncharacterized protein [Dermacentor albipictus]|uniref:uncharacterized protein n=1 Tax=Dermacentor albipictus TaxID=60249 RepID=UPI0031FD682D
MKGTEETTAIFIAAIFAVLTVSCSPSSYNQCPACLWLPEYRPPSALRQNARNARCFDGSRSTAKRPAERSRAGGGVLQQPEGDDVTSHRDAGPVKAELSAARSASELRRKGMAREEDHQLVSDAAISGAISSLKNIYFTEEFELAQWQWSPFALNLTSLYFSVEGTFEPFTRYCKGVDAMVDAELEFNWVVNAECTIGDQEDFLGAARVYFNQGVAKVQFKLNSSSENETFTLRPAAVRPTRQGTISTRFYAMEARYYMESVHILVNQLVKLYANDILSWMSERFVIENVLEWEMNKMAPFYLGF